MCRIRVMSESLHRLAESMRQRGICTELVRQPEPREGWLLLSHNHCHYTVMTNPIILGSILIFHTNSFLSLISVAPRLIPFSLAHFTASCRREVANRSHRRAGCRPQYQPRLEPMQMPPGFLPHVEGPQLPAPVAGLRPVNSPYS